jgi:non-homologous end joining protein Ku
MVGRVKYKKVSDVSGKELLTEDIERGYEITGGGYVIVDDTDSQSAESSALVRGRHFYWTKVFFRINSICQKLSV